jgi:outer membrane protein assembly factor BamA
MTEFFKQTSHSNKLKYKTLLISLLSFFSAPYAMPNDSIVSRRSLFIIPHPGYQQETSWSGGLAGGYYFKSNDLSRISSISGSADYTLLNQFMFNITPKIYVGKNKWYLYSNLNFKKYPDFYYGIGNKPTNIKQTFTSHNISLTLQPQYALTHEVLIGAILGGRYESLTTDSNFQFISDRVYTEYGKAGWEPFSEINLGFLISYDSRDNHFYPQKGIFAKSTLSATKAGWGSSYSVTDLSLDFRQYISIFRNHIFAYQAYYSGSYSKNEIPFQLLPTLGGRDLMRGFRQGMYRDNVLMLLQTEYRIPVYKRLKAAVFMSAGDVVNSADYKIEKLKLAYGAGLRYRLNDARVHLRVDLAKNNYGEKWQFYITATEAF